MTTENLVWALREVLQAEQDEKTARETFIFCGGRNWDYHGDRYAEASRKAGEVFQKALEDVIDARIRAAITTTTGESK